jgi:signal peptidase I
LETILIKRNYKAKISQQIKSTQMKSMPSKKKIDWKRIKKLSYEYGKLILLLFIITSSLVQGSRVPTPSMESTVLVGDWTIVNKLAYNLTTPRSIPLTNIELPFAELIRWDDPDRGDIVVFEFPGMRDEIKNPVIDYYVKRCIATPGDTITIRHKVLYVNGKEAPIPTKAQYLRNYEMPTGYSEEGIFPVGKNWNGDNYGPLVIPKKGDVIKLTAENINEWKTFIEREFGRSAVTFLDGKIFINGNEATEYKVEDDYYFMMGDNRDISLDCRYWGFVPRRNVIGSPIIIYWSWNSDIPWYDIFNLLGSIRIDRICKIPA